MSAHSLCRWSKNLIALVLIWSGIAVCFGTGLSIHAQAQSAVTVAITSPSTQSSFSTNRNALAFRGTAGSPAGIQRVTWWMRNIQTEGIAKGTENWEVDNIWLVPGTNELWVTAYDFAGNKTTNVAFITYQPEAGAPKINLTAPVAGQSITQGSKPLIAWYITGTTPQEWTRNVVVPDVVIDLYRNGAFITRLSDIASGVTSLSVFSFNYPEGDGYQLRLASYEGPNAASRYVTFSEPFRIGPGSAPVISSFAVAAANADESNNITVKLGEQINFRWQLSGGVPNQQVISNGVGDVTNRFSKLITASQVGQFVYSLTAANSAGSVSKQVTVNVTANNLINTAEVLHNGITLSDVWPPKPADYQDTTQLPSYLVTPPAVIPINTGRQLFVDDFLVESSTLTREFHAATMHPGNPVLNATTAVEKSGEGPMALPFSNGVFFDPADRLFKMWYMCGYRVNVCYATSTNGINWDKPTLDVVPGTNIVFKDTHFVDTYTNWIDLEETNPARRFKMLRVVYTDPDPLEFHLHYSADGIHWGPAVAVNKSLTYDRASFFYNPFRQKWGMSLKDVAPGPLRLRRYVENADLSFALNSVVSQSPSSAEMLFANTSKWLKADVLDTAHPDDPTFTPNLYALEASAYESLMLGQFAILRGSGNKPFGRPKLNEVYFGFSRDGFSWHRPNRQPMFSVSNTAGAWNWGNVQPLAGGPLVVGDQMYFYFSGRGGRLPGGDNTNDSNGATGLATMRRDGFASLNAGSSEGSITTRRVIFDGKYLFVNADISAGGSVCAEVLNDNNQAIAPFTKANCQPFTGNATKKLLSWTGASDMANLIGQSVKLRFYLKSGKLFSFWISPTPDGASRGYLGAGGPGYASYRDTGSIVANAPTVKLTPSIQSVTLGQTATLTYSITAATAASFSPSIPGCTITLSNGSANGNCTVTPGVAGNSTYTLQVTGNGLTTTASATVSALLITDTTPPVLTLTAPTQSTFAAGTTQVRVALTTNENATCRIALAADTALGSMSLLTQTGALAHSIDLATADGASYTRVVRCSDSAGNISPALSVNFSVANPSLGGSGDQALQFDGKTGVATVTSTVAPPLSKQWTIETWIKTTANPADFQTILGNSSGNDLRLSPGPNARATISLYTGSFTHFVGSKKINDGLWHHIVAVRNLDKLYLFVDGQADTDTDTRATVKTINNPAGDNRLTFSAIGNRGTAHEWYEGQVDEVRLHNRAMTASEIVTRYNNGLGQAVGNETSLALGFSFNESTGPALDFSSNLYRGTLTGGVSRVNSTRGGSTPTLQPAQIISFNATAGGVALAGSSATVTLGSSITLNWATSNVTSASISNTSCVISNPASGSCVHTPTATGQYTLTLSATGNGQTVTQSVSFLVVNATDTQRPVVTITPPSSTQITQGRIVLSGTAQDNGALVRVYFQTDRGVVGVAVGTNSWLADVVLGAGNNLITVYAQDTAGNLGVATINLVYDKSTTDTTPPVVTLTRPANGFLPLGTQQTTIEAHTEENASCRMASDPDTLFSAMTPFTQTGGTIHTFTMTTANGVLYSRMVRCSDEVGNVSNPQFVTFRIGGSDRSLSLDGVNGYVEVPGDSNLQTNQWTLEAWINTSASFNDLKTIIGNNSGSDLRLTGGANATVVVTNYNGAFTNMIGKRKVNDGQWHHVVGVREGSRLRIYVDGQLDSDQSDASNSGYLNVNLPTALTAFNVRAIGNRGTLDESYRGSLDNVRAYGRALSAGEVQARFMAGNLAFNVNEFGLFLGYDFNDEAGQVFDISGNGRTGILRGGITRVNK